MTGTNHGMTGAVIALAIRQPLWAVPLSFASHFVCDAIPHFGVPNSQLFSKKFNAILIADFLLAVTIMGVLAVFFTDRMWLIWTCMIAAASPDLAWGYYELYIRKLKRGVVRFDPLARFHAWIQWSQTVPGIVVEIIWFALMAALIVTSYSVIYFSAK